jgi:steroid 5-alpha reductase family enzyme
MTVFGFFIALAGVAAALSIVMSGAWFAWRRTGNAGWVDTVWTFGVGGIGVAAALLPFGTATTRRWIVMALIAAWALRLGLHIATRTAGITDDPRYARLVRDWGTDASRQMFLLLQKQALVSIPLAMSVVLAAFNPLPELRAQDLAGVLVFLIGIAGTATADRQLRAFRRDSANRNKVCDAGLWRWSRHPNYFFECVGWIAYPLIAIDLGGMYPFGFVALAGPLCIAWLLIYVSGIPPLEEHMLEKHGDAFRRYQARTSAFVPLPPRQGTST